MRTRSCKGCASRKTLSVRAIVLRAVSALVLSRPGTLASKVVASTGCSRTSVPSCSADAGAVVVALTICVRFTVPAVSNGIHAIELPARV